MLAPVLLRWAHASGRLGITSQSQLGRRCPVVVTAAATTYIFMLFPSDQFLNCRNVYFQHKGRRCNDCSFLSAFHCKVAQSVQAEPLGSDLGVVTQGFVHGRAHCSCKCEEGEKRSHGWFCFPLNRTTGKESLGTGLMLWQNSTNFSPWALQFATMLLSPRARCLTSLLFFKEDFSEHPVASLRILVFVGFFADFYFVFLALFMWNMTMDFSLCIPFCFSLDPRYGLSCSMQPGGALSPHPHGDGVWNSFI